MVDSADPATGLVGQEVTLLVGFHDTNVDPPVLHRTARVRQMSGKTRSKLGAKDIQRDPVKAGDVILGDCLVSLGSLSPVPDRAIKKLALGDCDLLIMEIRKLSMGDEVNVEVHCGSCQRKLDVTINLNDLEIVPLDPSRVVMVGKERGFRIRDDRAGVNAVFRFPERDDARKVAKILVQNPVRANYQLYATTLIEWNGSTGEEWTEAFFENQSLRILDLVNEEYMKALPGPIMKDKCDCPNCGVELELEFTSSDFLFPRAKRGSK